MPEIKHTKYQHSLDKSGDCAASGFSCEEQFKLLAESKGYEVEVASRNMQFSHVDFVLKKDGSQWKFECKGRKKIKRADEDFADHVTWIEFKRTDGKNGWIYGSADYLAIEQKSEFIIIARKDLQELAEKLVDRTKTVDKAFKAHNVSYRRFGRRDEISYISTSEIRKLNIKIWNKNANN